MTRTPPTVVLAMDKPVRDALFDRAALHRLAAIAHTDTELVVTDFTDTAHATQLAAAEVLLTGWGCPPLDGNALAAMPRLRTVIHAAGTVRHHITEACWERGITVTTVAGANALPVAEYTVAAILFAGKQVLQTARAYRAERGRVDLLGRFPSIGNYRRTVGIVGASRIGRRVIELLRPFDLTVLLHDPYVDEEDALGLGVQLVDLDALAARSDVLSLHAPELPATRHLLDRSRLSRLPDGATVINTARGSLVDTRALTDELVAGRLSAVLDHTEPELLPADSPLFELPNVLLTPHVAGSLGNELGRMADTALDELERYALGEEFADPVRKDILAHSA